MGHCESVWELGTPDATSLVVDSEIKSSAEPSFGENFGILDLFDQISPKRQTTNLAGFKRR